MNQGALRRVLPTLLIYAGVSWLVLGLSRWLRRVLALPGLFDALVFWGLVLGAALAVLVAWQYPTIVEGQDQRARPRPPGKGP